MEEEDLFLYTLREYLEAEEENELSRLLSQATLVFKKSSDYSNKQWNQRSVYIEIKVPVSVKRKVEEKKEKLHRYCGEIYEDDDEYGFVGIEIGVAMPKTIENEKEEESKEVSKIPMNQIYRDLIKKTIKLKIEKNEKIYIIEACECAINNNRIAAASMLGCAAELLLIQLCEAYLGYLNNGNGTKKEIKNFERKVLNANNAYTRLNEFKKRVSSNSKFFSNLGFDNPILNFNFLDIIRQVRNQSGHPTGIIISREDLRTMFGNYQLLIEKAHNLLTELPKL